MAKTLLDVALEAPLPQRVAKVECSADELDLLIAYCDGRVSASQVGVATETNGNAAGWLQGKALAALRQGLLVRK